MINEPRPSRIEGWVCVMDRSTDYEVQLAKYYLTEMEIPSNILSKRDSAYSLNVGAMAHVYLYVPIYFEEAAREALTRWEHDDKNYNDQGNNL